MMYDAVIIGGGISGLTAAYDLHRRGRSVMVLERQQQVGGNAITERIDGFLMEHGPTTLNTMVPEALDLTAELGLQDQRLDLGDGVQKRYLRQQGKLHGISTKPMGFLLSPYLSWSGRLSVITEILRSRKTGTEDETIHDFTARRFGVEFAEKVMDPLAAGMFGGDAKRLSMKAVFPKLIEMEHTHGSITRSIIHAKRGAEPGKRLFSFRSGLGSLPQALAHTIAGSVKTGVTVKAIAPVPGGYRVETTKQGNVAAKSVILSVQAHVAGALLERLDVEGATAASDIAAPPMSVVFLGYKRDQIDHPLDSLGFLSAKGAGGIITGAQFCSTMFEERAPDGHASIAAYVGGTRNPQAACMERSDLIAEVHQELAGLLQIRGRPVLSRCRQWARSLPQLEVGHEARVEVLNDLSQRHPGLYVTGNYIKGVSITNCIGQARAVSAEVNTYLGLGEHWALTRAQA